MSSISLFGTGCYPLIEHTSIDEESIMVHYDKFKGYIVKYNGNSSKIELPQSFVYNNEIINVDSIFSYAFANCKDITNISFVGTKEEWNALDKMDWWNEGLNVTIHCTDCDLII